MKSGIMKVRNTSPRDEVVVLKVDGARVVNTIAPDAIFELPKTEGLNLCKAKGTTFVPEGKESQALLKSTIPVPEEVTVVRNRSGQGDQAEKDIEQGEKSGN